VARNRARAAGGQAAGPTHASRRKGRRLRSGPLQVYVSTFTADDRQRGDAIVRRTAEKGRGRPRLAGKRPTLALPSGENSSVAVAGKARRRTMKPARWHQGGLVSIRRSETGGSTVSFTRWRLACLPRVPDRRPLEGGNRLSLSCHRWYQLKATAGLDSHAPTLVGRIPREPVEGRGVTLEAEFCQPAAVSRP
jgi:hypothetical protein